MLENLSLKTRYLIFLVALVIFFALYDRYVMQPQSAAASARAAAERVSASNSSSSAPSANAPTGETAAPAVSSPAPITDASASAGENVLARVKTKISELEFDDFGRIAQASLTEAVFAGDDHSRLKLFDPSNTRALEVRFRSAAINESAFKTPYAASASEIDASEFPADLNLTQNLEALTIVKEMRFYPDGHYDLKVTLTQKEEFFITPGSRPIAASDQMVVQGALTQLSSGAIETIADGDAKGGESFIGARMLSAFDRYYATILFNYESAFAVNFLKYQDGLPLGFIRSDGDLTLGGYIGPKYVQKLRAVNPELTNAVEYGFFTFLSKPLFAALEWIHSLVPNWGWSIVIFTLLVKIVLFPLSHKGMVSMSRLKDIAPKMKELQEKYKDDKQKLQIHMMELYKKHNANPLGGCLPLLIQIPIFFAIYRVLLNAIELKGAEWFYIGDLSLKDPFFALPLLMGATMWFQQKITPSNFTDPLQEKLFKWLPVIFTAFFLFFPAGLVLYWLINNIVSIAQQRFVNTQIEKAKLKREQNVKN